METTHPVLIVVRGNSGSGKSSVAEGLRRLRGRGLAVVAQDNVRRTILKEKDEPGAVNISMIEQMVRFVLQHGYSAVLEGILYADHYGEMLGRLQQQHEASAHFFYLDVSFTETVHRHRARPQSQAFTPEDMKPWYRPMDLVPGLGEYVISEASSLEETVRVIASRSGLQPQE